MLKDVDQDPERCYRAVRSKDPRFDGWFFTAVTTTGVYCRPSCPATAPKPQNCRFYPTAAAAQQAGFRACKRCRPDAAPGSPEWDTRSDVVARAMRLIADGIVDRGGVAALASALGYSRRQLERALLLGAGAGPLALARAQRAQAARLLVETTDMPMAEVAFAAGFASIRQFNGTVRQVFALSPTEMRRRTGGHARRGGHARTAVPPAAQTVVLRLPYRRPLFAGNLFGHLAATAIPGVEEVRDGSYRRVLVLDHGTGTVSLSPADGYVRAALCLADLRDLGPALARCRRLLDLDADPEAVDERLAADAALAPLVARARGRRVPRAVDEAEMAVRAVLGQQVSTTAARALGARLAQVHGVAVDDPSGGLTRSFPTAPALASALSGAGVRGDGALRMPEARRAALAGLVAAIADGRLTLGPGTDWDEARARLLELPGIGAWTAEVIAMRALGDPDAFPVNDVGLQKGATAAGLASSLGALTARAERWRPWRSYATQHLWALLDHPINQFQAGRGAA